MRPYKNLIRGTLIRASGVIGLLQAQHHKLYSCLSRLAGPLHIPNSGSLSQHTARS
jgi:hypothetical protein